MGGEGQAQLLYLRELEGREPEHMKGEGEKTPTGRPKEVSSLRVALRASLACLLRRHRDTVCLGLLLLHDFVLLILRDHSFYPKQTRKFLRSKS